MSVTIAKLKDLDEGVYLEARKEGLSLSQWLGELGRKGELSEDLYRPDVRNSKGELVDPFKQLIAAAGIRTKGELAQTGDAFFSDPTNRVLFPEYVSRQYRDTERALPPLFVTLADLVTNREGINSNAYRSGIITGTPETELEFGRVAEGAELPRYVVKLSDKAINVYKYGGILQMTYESVRRASLPMLNRYIAKIARAQVRRKIKHALSVALNGDGNANPAVNSAASGSAWTYADLVALHFAAATGGTMLTTIIGDSTEIGSILNMAQFVDAGATGTGAAFRDNGELPSPLGITLKLALPGSVLEGSRKLLGVDSQDALVEVYENGSEITESDKLIHTQFDMISLSENLAYAKPETLAFVTKTRAV